MESILKWGPGHRPTARRFAVLLASLALLAPVPGLLLAPAGRAVTACEGFVSWSAGSYSCVVAPGVTSLQYTVVGGPGGGIMQGGTIITPGGTAAQVKGMLPVTPGETLYLTVGGWGTNNGTYPASGGGYSSIARVVDATTVPLVVAGGGGGAGPANAAARGGNGGTTGTGGGGDGGSDTHPAGYAGGTAPTGGAGGSAGYGPGGNGGTYPTSVNGTSNYSGGGGAFGGNGGGGLTAGGYAGGGGANSSGGGGGGGYGGGGGGTLAYNGVTYGTGGGGGSSLVPSGGTATLAGTGSGVLLAARPDAPTMSAPIPSVNKVTLSWTAPALNGGATVRGYNLYQGTTSGGEGTTPVNGTTLITATSFEVTGLTNGTTYYFTVAAKNDIGEGPASNEVSARPSAVVPGAPIMATPTIAPGQVTLSWTAPSYQGGSAVTGYNVYQATTSGDQGTTPVNETPITDTTTTISGLIGGTTYYFTVAAVNEIGQGPVSNEVSATPTSTLPGAPAMRMPSGGPAQVTLSWTAPTYEGASTVTSYDVFQATTSGGQGTTPVNATPITDTSTTITGLTNGTTYYFTVKARNSAGLGAASAEASVVPGARYLYYRSGEGTIGRMELGGSNTVDNSFVTGVSGPFGIAVDGSHIYWTSGGTSTGWIGRANLDGSGINNQFIPTGDSQWVTVDGGHIYWSNGTNAVGCGRPYFGSLGRANLDGSNVDQCWMRDSYNYVPGSWNPQGLAVDPSYVYWINAGGPSDIPEIMRANIDGSDPQRIVASTGPRPHGLAVDANHIYWAGACENVGSGSLGLANLDGASSNPYLSAGLYCPIGIAVRGSALYFTNWYWPMLGLATTAGSYLGDNMSVTSSWGIAVGVGIAAGPAPATHFTVTAPSSAMAGTPFTVTVTAKDADENTATDYAGTVHFTSSDGTAALPSDATLTNGTGTFNVTLKTVGNQTITATDTVTSTITGASAGIPVAAPTTCASAGSTPITSMAELQAINAASTLANGRYQLLGHYCLTANLDASGFGNFTPIGGPALPFTGIFDGEGHTISNLTIDLPSSSWVGLFGFIASGAQVKDLGLVNVTVHGADATGALAGENAKFVESGSGGTITNVYVTGTVTGTQNTGGLVGVNQTQSSITSSYSTATVSGTYNVGGLVGSNWGPITSGWSSGSVTGSGQNVGGLVGNHTSAGTSVGMITRSWSSGSVSGANATGGLVGLNANATVDKSYSSASVTGGGSSTGGLVGYNNTITGGHATVQNSYSTGSVSGTGSTRGGLVGANGSGSYILVSHSTGAVSGSGTYVGGLVGSNNGPTTTTNSYWNRDTSGQNTSAGGTGRTDAEMRVPANFGGFDFGVVWSAASGVTYPYFKWQAPVITTVAPAAGAPSVSSAANITVTFGTAMADASFGDATFYLTHPGSATHVAAAISVSADHLTATLDPSANLAPATTYTVTVIGGTGGVTDASGHALSVPGSGPYAGKWHWTFTTGPCANDGTPITTMNQLQGIGGTTGPLSGNYCLAADLDAGGFPFTPIGTSSAPFYGSFDGQGHTISNLAISQASTANVGLFGYVGNGTGSGVISNVGLVNVSVSGGGQTGGLVGWLSGSYESPVVNILNSYVTGTVHGHDSTGGLVGYDQWGNITNSFSAASVYGWASTGGLAGQNYATITMSYSTGAVQGTYMNTGGLVGSNYGPIANSYATGNVTGANNWVGGLVGYTSASVTYSFSTGKVTQTGGYYAGGFAGWNLNPQNMHSYWDTDTSWRGSGLGGFNGAVTGLAGLADPAMRQQASFSGWDFTNIWTIDEGSTYPYLRWQAGPAGVVPSIFALPAGVTVTEGQPASFTAAAGGNPAPTIQWQESSDGGTTWADISGAATSPLGFSAQLTQAGYKYRAVFTNASGSAYSAAATLTVTPGTTATTISAVSGSGDYGVTASITATLKAGTTPLSGKTISFTLNGTPVGSTETDENGVATLDAVYLGSIGAGTHTGYVGASFAGDATYAASGPVTGDLVVAKAYQAALSITGPSTATFGDEDATISTAGGDGMGEITFSAGISTACSIVSGKLHVTSGTGDCTLVATKAADANHYLTVSQGWPVTIGKAAQSTLSITTGQTFPYSSSTFTPTTTGGSGTGAVTFTSSTASICTASGSTVVTIVAAGTCSLTAVKAGDDDYDDSATSASEDVTITVPLTETAISAVSGSGTYAADGTVTATLMAGTSPVSGVMVSFSRNGMPLGSATTDESGVATMSASMGSIPAGTHTGYVVAWFTGDETYAASGPVSGDLVVAKAGQSISFTAPTDVHYGDTIFGLGATADSTLTVTYESLTTSVCTFEAPPAYGPVALRLAPVGPQLRIVGVGDCKVRASQAGDANYEAAPVVDRTFTTQKAPLSITADADTTTVAVDHFSRAYGEANPIFDVRYAGFVNMEGPEDLDGTLDYDTTATSTSDVGAYAVTPAGLTSSNYEITFGAGVLDIGKASQAPLTITGPSTATYGDADATVSTGGGSGTGDVTFSAGSSSACSIVSGKLHVVSGAGTCSLTATKAGDTNHDPATSAAYPVTIGKAALSVTADADPTTAAIDNFTKAFGAPLPAFTVRYAGFVNGDTADVLGGTLGFETTATSTSDVGAYAVMPSGLTSSDYDISFAAGVLDIGKAGQTISFTSTVPESPTYGGSYAVSATGGGSGNPVTFGVGSGSSLVCSVAGSTVTFIGAGDCTVTANQAGSANYDAATQATQSFTVGRAPLSVTADANPTTAAIDHFARAHDAADPAFTVRFAGFVNGDDAADLGGLLDFDTESVASSSVGAYGVTPLGLTSSTYEITFVAGVLDIGIAGQSISFTAPTGVRYGDANRDLGATATSGLSVSYASSTESVCVIVGGELHVEAAGTCTVTASQGGNTDHDAAPSVSRTFTIGKATQSITFAELPDRTYGDPDFTVSATASSGLAVHFHASGSCTIVGTTVHLTGAGSCTITAHQDGDLNHDAASAVVRTFDTGPAVGTVAYIGQTLFVTSGPKSTTAQVRLTASVVGTAGDISTARVTFIDDVTHTVLARGVRVSPVAGSSSPTGTATVTVTLGSGKFGAQGYLVRVVLDTSSGSSYENEEQLDDPTSRAFATLSVIVPGGTNTAKGDADVTPVAAAGEYGEATGVHYTIGLKYNKGGSSPQGQIFLTFDLDGFRYYVKSNSISSITCATQSGPCRDMTIYTKASIYRVDGSGVTTSVDGNVTLRVDLHDAGGTATGDAIGFTVLSSKTGQLYWSNNWAYDADAKAWRTMLQAVSAAGGVAVQTN